MLCIYYIWKTYILKKETLLTLLSYDLRHTLKTVFVSLFANARQDAEALSCMVWRQMDKDCSMYYKTELTVFRLLLRKKRKMQRGKQIAVLRHPSCHL